MKQKYIQPAMLVVEVDASEVMVNSKEVNVQMLGTTYEFDAPRTRLWGNDED
jgi:hypothetical protein